MSSQVACETAVYTDLKVYQILFAQQLGYDDRLCLANQELLLADPGESCAVSWWDLMVGAACSVEAV